MRSFDVTKAQGNAAMDERLSLPPLFTAAPLDGDASPLRAARAAAEGEDAMGRLFYARRPDRLEAALVLAPERRLADALPVLYPLQLGLCDALGALLPPQYAVQFGWPDRIYLNGALCGALALEVPRVDAKAEIAWMTAGLSLALMGRPGDLDPGRTRETTSFYDEGAGDVAPGAIIEAFARHFLSWLMRWEERGLAALWPAWQIRALGHDEAVVFPGPKGTVTGLVAGLTRAGNLRVKTEAGLVALPLRQVLERRGWALAGGA